MRTILIALLTALFGGALAFIGGDVATKAHHVSDMEGGRAMGVVFLITPAGFLVGLVVGVALAKLMGQPGFAGFAKVQGLAWLITAAVGAAVFGYYMSIAPRRPMLDGKYLRLDFEVRMPEGRSAPDSTQEFTVLMTSRGQGDDRHNAELRLDAVSQSEGRAVIPAGGLLHTSVRNRSLVINDLEGKYYWFDYPLRAKPTSLDTAWTSWWPKPGEPSGSDIRGSGGFQIRYRVVPVAP